MGFVAIVQTIKMINKYFEVGVTSVARDGVAPELNPGRAHRRTNTNSEVRHSPQLAVSTYEELQARLTHAVLCESRYSFNVALARLRSTACA